ncbi:MAG: winged helix-turn-helix domain-containing protein [Mycobacteriaceae bacterium]|nr:winged helix-turn-helix domain-containing protein [Mycobacteriaceae bacterium]
MAGELARTPDHPEGWQRDDGLVLAVLLIDRNRPVSVDALIDAVWAGSPVPAARTSIQSHISNLRRLLCGGDVDPVRVLASAPPGYPLNVADTDCYDLSRFAAGRFEEAERFDCAGCWPTTTSSSTTTTSVATTPSSRTPGRVS